MIKQLKDTIRIFVYSTLVMGFIFFGFGKIPIFLYAIIIVSLMIFSPYILFYKEVKQDVI